MKLLISCVLAIGIYAIGFWFYLFPIDWMNDGAVLDQRILDQVENYVETEDKIDYNRVFGKEIGREIEVGHALIYIKAEREKKTYYFSGLALLVILSLIINVSYMLALKSKKKEDKIND